MRKIYQRARQAGREPMKDRKIILRQSKLSVDHFKRINEREFLY
jgi:hypothetical protein